MATSPSSTCSSEVRERMRIETPWPRPTVPGLRESGGRGLEVTVGVMEKGGEWEKGGERREGREERREGEGEGEKRQNAGQHVVAC